MPIPGPVSAEGSAAPAGAPPERQAGELPLSFAQQRLWFLDRLRPGLALYNMAFAFTLRGDLKAPVLALALAQVVRRHEVLRTSFVQAPGGEPRQAIAAEKSSRRRANSTPAPECRAISQWAARGSNPEPMD